MSAPTLRLPALSWLYNHNPFYFLSALLMLFAVRSAYGELRIGFIDCWGMLAVLAGYTAVLAAIGVLIVRRGKVWEDARSILVTLLLLFLAVSVSADDLFVAMQSPLDGGLLLVCGYLFCAAVTEAVLRATRIRLPALYRVPLHLMLGLFYVAPWWCAPDLHPRSVEELEWAIFAFPLAAAGILLLLWPAARRGPSFVADNGTPWGWPMFPWSAFAVISVAVALRTFALCMTFGPVGPIWIPSSSTAGGPAISFDTMWGPYFLVPPAFSIFVLLLEGSVAAGNRRLLQRLMWLAPLLLLLAIPVNDAPVSRGFLDRFVATAGSPVFLTVGLVLAFYGLAWLRGVAGAATGALVTLSLLSVIGRETIGVRSLQLPQPWPLLVVGGLLLISGLHRRSSAIATLSSMVLCAAVWLALPMTDLAGWRNSISLHLLGGAVITLSLSFKDEFATLLRWIGAGSLPVAALAALTADVPPLWQLAYVATVILACYVIAICWKSRAYLYAFLELLSLGGYGAAVLAYRGAATTFGKAATVSFAWSVAALLVAFLISAHKAAWLPPRLLPRWRNGHHLPPAPAPVDKRMTYP